MPERYLGRSLGRFRIETLIGSGGFAWVYKGYDPELDIPVAVKVLKPQFSGDEAIETRFRKEASTAAKLRHPNIVRILAVGREEAAVYFVMDYLPGGLVEKLKVMGTLPEPMLIRLGLDVSAALAFAHQEGVIHRDIKTDNVLYDVHGNAVVADFGIARALVGYVEQTGTNMVVGTPQYFSPEQARGLALDGRVDIYSLGVTLFKAATGALPFQGNDWYDFARQHVEEPPPRPRSLNPALSEEMERIILRCLEKDRDLRFPDAQSLNSALRAIASPSSQEGTVLMPTPTGTRSLTPVSGEVPASGSRLSLLIGLAMALLIGGTVIASVWRPRPAPVTTVAGRLLPPPVIQPDSSDSLAAAAADTVDSAAAAAAAVPPPPPARMLVVSAPAGATISVNGHDVGHAPWHTDTLPPGSYKVTAEIPAPSSCTWATQSRTVNVGRSGRDSVALDPRGCGTLQMDLKPAGTRYTITTNGHVVKEGTFDAEQSTLLLPTGSYHIELVHSLCAQGAFSFRISEGGVSPKRFRMYCDTPP